MLEIFLNNIENKQTTLQRPTPMEIEAPPLPPHEPIQMEEVKEDVQATMLPTIEGQFTEDTHFDFKMDMDEQQKEEADEKLVILALQGISILRDTLKEDTSKEEQQTDDQTQEVPDSLSFLHYDEQTGIMTIKRQIFTSCDQNSP